MNLIVEIDEKAKTIDIYGGESCCTKDDPYWIPFDRVWESWVSHLSQKTWTDSDDLRNVERALNKIRKQNQRG